MTPREFIAEIRELVIGMVVFTGIMAVIWLPLMFPDIAQAVALLGVVGLLGTFALIPILRAMGLDE